ncbi:LOW QUALITY PROTEIN: hypothetical protein PHMEG_000909 [Phytophthora megakarya]|uniref:Reverse transcriptase n=1 Tax=Phytophthora megakarya TaxID=4795 RepID=A0A225X4F2_9STRA|nr:LOW QUALITY PROTEIN: hypothetical protein PHMEG_000909 [Phytophthora megakarya]
MVQDVFQNSHDSLEGGREDLRTKTRQIVYGLLIQQEQATNCYSSGNILAERPFQIVSKDFVIPYRNLGLETRRCYYSNVPSQVSLWRNP